MKDEVWRLLRRNISMAQIAGYALTNLAGVMIIITGLQLYRDVTSGDGSDDDVLATEDFMILSPKVDGLGSLMGTNKVFTAEDIADLKAQPWVKSVGEFKSAEFSVSAGLNFGGRGMSTQLFLESVPDEFIDVNLREWDFKPGSSKEVPIVISKDYLALYNFGFAASRSLPRISEAMVGMVPLELMLSGNGMTVSVPGRIVGFSQRLNTIAVPESFIDWANHTFSSAADTEPSRLIVQVDNPGNPAIERYLDNHGYETAGGSEGVARASYVMGIVTSVVIGIGVVISILSLVILLLSISLLMQKNRDKIASLILLGYSPAKVAGYYVRVVCGVNAVILLLAAAALLCVRHAWEPALSEMGMRCSSPAGALATGAVIMVAVTLINVVYIRRAVSRC